MSTEADTETETDTQATHTQNTRAPRGARTRMPKCGCAKCGYDSLQGLMRSVQHRPVNRVVEMSRLPTVPSLLALRVLKSPWQVREAVRHRFSLSPSLLLNDQVFQNLPGRRLVVCWTCFGLMCRALSSPGHVGSYWARRCHVLSYSGKGGSHVHYGWAKEALRASVQTAGQLQRK